MKKVSTAVKWWKKQFNKELVLTKKSNEDFKNSTKYWIYNNIYVDDNVKGCCCITGKYNS